MVTATPDGDETLNAVSLTPTGDLRVAWAQPDGIVPGHNDIHAVRARLDDGTNEPPVLLLPADLTVDATTPSGAIVSFEASATDDAGTPTVTCVPASGTTFAIGSTTVACSVTDDDGATVSGSFTVSVRGARDQVTDLLTAVAGVGPGRSLTAKLREVLDHLADGSLQPACDVLREFAGEVRAQSGKRIPAGTADLLLEDAARIRAVLACP